MISKNQIKLARQLEQKKYRLREGLFVAEGPKVVGDLLHHGFRPAMLFATGEWLGRNHVEGIEPQQVTADELQRISFLQHPQQVFAMFPIPSVNSDGGSSPLPRKGELCLALDGVQDPGNLGTIIRIADWFGIEHIFCSEDTADVWNPKVVQATMGSIARVSICYTDLATILEKTDMPVYGTLLDGDDIYREALTDEGIIVMGNEGKGISPAIRKLVSRKLLIPNYSRQADTAESLNVAIATAITCSEFRRRRSNQV